MTTVEIILLVLVILVAILLYLTIKRRGNSESGEFLQREIAELRRALDDRLGRTQTQMDQTVREQFRESQRLIRDITKEIAEVKEGNKQVFTLAEALGNLEKVLTHQKQRGELGEAGLKLILENILPPGAYEFQYEFSDRTVVDAIIKTKDGIIPIDAKFSLDNYNRAVREEDADRKAQYEKDFRNDLKKRIDETSKYIRESEGTLPFALMYIPAEGIYYDLLIGSVGGISINSRDMIDYAHRDKKVIIVSPTTFVAYLHTILQGFRAFQIEERAKEIEKNVALLGRHLSAYEEYHAKLGNSLGTVVNHYNRSQKELKKVDKDVYKITGSTLDIEDLAIDGPSKGEE